MTSDFDRDTSKDYRVRNDEITEISKGFKECAQELEELID